MRNTVVASIGGLAAALTLAWFVSAPLDGQAQTGAKDASGDKGEKYAAPRTSWGDPDLQGQWNSQTSTPLERPQSGVLAQKDSLSEEEAESIESANLARADGPPAAGDPGTYNSFWFDRGKGLSRTSLIIDPPEGRVPAYTPEAEQRLAAARAERATRGPADSYADLPIWPRCITRGWNGIGSNYSSNTQIFQSPGYVVIFQELIHESRVIPLDGRDGLPADVQQWLGVSRGRWDGDTLVVETRNFDPRSSYRGSSPELLLTERYTRAAADAIDYRFTMHDPKTYVKDWTVARPMRRETGKITIFEYACHEGNYAMEGILAGARLQDKEAAATRAGRNAMRRLVAIGMVVAGAALLAPAAASAQVSCTRDGLQRAVNLYLAAQAKGDPSGLPLATGLGYVENMTPTDITKGVIKAPMKIDHHRSQLDPATCQTFTEVIVTDKEKPYVLGTRLRVNRDKIAEVEILWTTTGYWLFNADTYLKWSSGEKWDVIPANRRDSRDTLVAAANAYLDAFLEGKKDGVPWGYPCNRTEGGAHTGTGAPTDSCDVGVPSGVNIANRRFIVDETTGSVVAFCTFGAGGPNGGSGAPDTHLFRIENGKLRYVHTLTHLLQTAFRGRGAGPARGAPPPQP